VNEGLTLDGALGGAVTLVQPADGYRFSLDAILLARFAAETPASVVLDLGCGCGVVGLCVLALGGAERLEGVDIQAQMVDCARGSARRSGLGERAAFRVGDYRERIGVLPGGGYPLVVSNPPYRPPGSGQLSPRPGVALARHEVCGTVEDLARSAAGALRQGGSFCVVYPAARLPMLLAACEGSGLQPRSLRCVYPRERRPASLVLLRCTKGAGGGLEVRPPLVLHGAGGAKYSAEAATLLGPP
jgi:tRNA1Val (adenine37-N6)-methyltransferase